MTKNYHHTDDFGWNSRPLGLTELVVHAAIIIKIYSKNAVYSAEIAQNILRYYQLLPGIPISVKESSWN
jgi:hypothetical protein